MAGRSAVSSPGGSLAVIPDAYAEQRVNDGRSGCAAVGGTCHGRRQLALVGLAGEGGGAVLAERELAEVVSAGVAPEAAGVMHRAPELGSPWPMAVMDGAASLAACA